MRAVQLRKREEGRAELCRAAARCDTSIVLNVEECLCACVCVCGKHDFFVCVLCDIYRGESLRFGFGRSASRVNELAS